MKTGHKLTIMIKYALGVFLLVVSSASAKPWTLSSAFQFSRNTGNVEDRNIGLENEAVYDLSNTRLTGKFDYETYRDDTKLISESYFTDMKSDFKYNKIDYLFSFFRWEKDKFKDLDYRYTLGVGYGAELLKSRMSPNRKLILELGGLRSWEKPVGTVDRAFSSLRSFIGFDHKLAENISLKFGNEYIYEINDTRGYLLNNNVSLVSKINSKLSFKAGVRVKYDSNPPGTAKRRDTRTTVSLVLSI